MSTETPKTLFLNCLLDGEAYNIPLERFGVDKRKSHFSALIRNGEMTREEALAELTSRPYELLKLKKGKQFVLKKLGFSEEEFDKKMQKAPRRHDEYVTDRIYTKPIVKLGKLLLGK